jgi:uncharacterized membrane protein YfcA
MISNLIIISWFYCRREQDWDLVMIMEPTTILGALFGSFLNRLLPEFFLILMLAIVLAATANKTLKKGFTLWAKETKENKARAALEGPHKKGGYDRVANEDDLERALNAADNAGAESKNGWTVWQKVRVRNQPTESWKRATVTGFKPGPAGVPLSQREGHAVAYTWNEMEAADGSSGPLSPQGETLPRHSGDGAKSPSSPGELAEADGGDVITEMAGLEGIGEKVQPVGTVAPDSVVALFAELPYPIGFTKTERVLCQRSNGEWCHAKVHVFENWPPEGGTLTLQVDKYRRKVLDLSKRRHLLRVRVLKARVDALNSPFDAAQSKAPKAPGAGGPGGALGRASSSGGRSGREEPDNRWDELDGAAMPQGANASQRLQDILKAESVNSPYKIGLVVLSFLGVCVLDLSKETAACGSSTYYLATFLTIPYVALFFFTYRRYLINMQAEKVQVGYVYLPGDVKWDNRSTVIYPVLCIFAGFFAGMFGVGGGIIKGPLMLEMGILPQVASANAAAMILFTTGTACLSFFLFGAIDTEVAGLLFFLGIVCTGAGQYYVGLAIKKANRSSLIVLSMGFVVVFSAILLTIRSIIDAATREGGMSELMAMGQLCEAEEHGEDIPVEDAMSSNGGFGPSSNLGWGMTPAPAPASHRHGHFVYDDDQ